MTWTLSYPDQWRQSLICIGLLSAGCSQVGTAPLTAPSTATVSNIARCPIIDTSALNATEVAAISEARDQACATISSDVFADLMRHQQLRETCNGPATIDGMAVRALLLTQIPDHQIVSGKPWLAEAVTNPVTRRIKIRRLRFRNWIRRGPRQQDLINTLVHEWTHLIIGADGYSRFQDRGHGSKCPDASLVSYRTGDLAADAWQKLYPRSAPTTGDASGA